MVTVAGGLDAVELEKAGLPALRTDTAEQLLKRVAALSGCGVGIGLGVKLLTTPGNAGPTTQSRVRVGWMLWKKRRMRQPRVGRVGKASVWSRSLRRRSGRSP